MLPQRAHRYTHDARRRVEREEEGVRYEVTDRTYLRMCVSTDSHSPSQPRLPLAFPFPFPPRPLKHPCRDKQVAMQQPREMTTDGEGRERGA